MARLPLGVVKVVTPWRRAEQRLRDSLSRAPDFDEVADALGLTAPQRVAVAAALRIRFEGSGSEELHLGERAASCSATAAASAEAVEAEDERAMVLSRLSRLDGREWAIVELRYGMVGGGLTLREVGGRIGLTRERVRQIEAGALAKLVD